MAGIRFITAILILTGGVTAARESNFELAGNGAADGERPLNVILMIGDGMGLSQVSSTFYFSGENPAFSEFKCIGLARTSSASDVVTMSSAAATAMSCGRKTYNLAIGVDMDTVPIPNLVEILSEIGYATGVIATASITDATPAGFYAHQASRTMQREIAGDLTRSEIDFFAGGGIKYFLDTTGYDCFRENGIEVNYARLRKVKNPEPGDRVGFLLAADRMPAVLEGRKDFLAKASEIGIDFLSSVGEGFFLMIEGSQIDWAGHGNQADYLISEMDDFNETVNRVLDYVKQDGRTLLIVTADHETGGFALSAGGEGKEYTDYSVIEPMFATNRHTATLVPVFAYGPGAEDFTGVYENTEIFHKIVSLLLTENQ